MAGNPRREIGPSITYYGKDDMSTKIANKTEWVEVDGIRRLVVEGQPIPVGLGLEDQAQDEEINPRTLTQPVVDEEASKPLHERNSEAPDPDPTGGVSTENVEKVGAATRRRQSRSGGGSSSGGGSES